MTKSVNQYGIVAKLFHWLSAITVIALFAVGYWMVDLTYYSEWYKIAPYWHKSIGLCLFVVTALRLLWKITSKSPEIEGAGWEKLAAKSAHAILYVLLFCIFISGYMISTADGRGIEVFNWFTVPGFGSFIENQEDLAGIIHYYLAYSVIGLALIHGLAALKHHFIDKDNTLKKML